jgi:hypothetical protein
MAAIDTAVQTVHVLFAGLWTGSVVLFAIGVLPSGVQGDIGTEPLARITGSLTTLSRVSVLLLLVTGGHLAGTLYTVETLTGTTRGYLVLAMVGLWLVMAGLVEVGGSRMREGLAADKIRTPARESRPFYRGAAVVAVLSLVDAGLLAGGVV